MKTIKNTNKTTTANLFDAVQFELLNRFGRVEIFLNEDNTFTIMLNNERTEDLLNFDYKYSNYLNLNNVYQNLTKTNIKEQLRDLIKLNKNIKHIKSCL